MTARRGTSLAAQAPIVKERRGTAALPPRGREKPTPHRDVRDGQDVLRRQTGGSGSPAPFESCAA